jgi:hypothetical protein
MTTAKQTTPPPWGGPRYACFDCGRLDLHTDRCPCGAVAVWVIPGLSRDALCREVHAQVEARTDRERGASKNETRAD